MAACKRLKYLNLSKNPLKMNKQAIQAIVSWLPEGDSKEKIPRGLFLSPPNQSKEEEKELVLRRSRYL